MDRKQRRLEREAATGDRHALTALARLHERAGHGLQAYLLYWYAGVDRPTLALRLSEAQTESVHAAEECLVYVATDGVRRGPDPWDVEWDWQPESLIRERPVLAASASHRLMSEAHLAAIVALRSLVVLDLGPRAYPPRKLSLLERLPFLTCLRLGRQSVSDRDLGRLAGLTALRALDLSAGPHRHGRVTGKGFRALADLPHLRTLYLRRCAALTRPGLVRLAELRQLRTLSLEGCSELTDTKLRGLSDSSGLRELDLVGCSSLTRAGLLGLTALGGLRRLELDARCDLDAEGARRLRTAIPDLQIVLATGSECRHCGALPQESGTGRYESSPPSFETVHFESDGRDFDSVECCRTCGTYWKIAFGDDPMYQSFDRERVQPTEALRRQPETAARELERLARVTELRAACAART